MRTIFIQFWVISFWMLLFSRSTSVFAQQGRGAFHFNHLTDQQGLPDNWCHRVLMDKKGYLWIGMQDGLARYDGRQFKHYRENLQQPGSLRGTSIIDLAEDDNGHIWVAATPGGASRFDPATETFTQFHLPFDTALVGLPQSNSAIAILPQADGQVWVGTYDNGLMLLDPDSGVYRQFKLNSPLKDHDDAFRRNTVMDIVQDPDHPDRLWIAGNDGLYRFSKSEETFEKFAVNCNGVIDNSMACLQLWMDKPGEIWVATWWAGVVRFDIATASFECFPIDPQKWAQRNYFANIVKGIYPKSPTELWVASQDQGLCILDIPTKTYRFVRHQADDPYSVLSNAVTGVYVDREQRVWVLNDQAGISIIDPSNQYFAGNPLPAIASCPQPSENEIIDFAFDTKRQLTYVSANACGSVYVLDKRGEVLQTLTFAEHKGTKLSMKLAVDPQGRCWIGGGGFTNKYALFVYDPDQQQAVPFQHPDLDKIPLHRYRISDLTFDSQGKLYLATTGGGLVCIDFQQDKIYQYAQNDLHRDYPNPQFTMTNLLIDRSGDVWMATYEGGIFRFNPKDRRFSHYGIGPNALQIGTVMSLLEDARGQIWAATNGKGVHIIDPAQDSTQTMRLIGMAQGLPSEVVGRMALDPMGNIWMATQKGLCRYDTSAKAIIHYGRREGLPVLNLTWLGLQTAPDGKLVLGQHQGFARFAPLQMQAGRQAPSVVLDEFKVFDQTLPLDQALSFIDKIDLTYQQNFFSISFAALNLSQPEKNRYAYRLLGFIDDWVYPPAGQTTAFFTNVHPGTYTFQVKAANNEGIWNENGKSLQIYIAAPWWQTWWFYVLTSLFIAGSALAYFRWRIYNIRRQEQERNRVQQKFAELELQALQAQMNPHFVYNALSAI